MQQELPKIDLPRDQKYVWHIATGGMTHMLSLISHSAIICKKLNRKLIINCKNNIAFGVNFDELFFVRDSDLFASPAEIEHAVNLWKPFDAQLPQSIFQLEIGRIAPASYALRGVSERNGNKRYLHTVYEEDRIAVTAALSDYAETKKPNYLAEIIQEIRLKPFCIARAQQLHRQLPQDYIGCHFRNTDYQDNFELAVQSIKSSAEKLACKSVFIATDDISSIPRFRKSLPDYDLYFNEGVLIDVKMLNGKNLHCMPLTQLAKVGMSKIDQHSEFFADVYILARAKEYLPSPRSGVKRLVNLFRNHPELLNSFYASQSNPSYPEKLGSVRSAYGDSRTAQPLVPMAAKENHIKKLDRKNIIASSPLIHDTPESRHKHKFIFHTKMVHMPFAIFDLDNEVYLQKIRIINRNGNQDIKGRAQGLKLHISCDLFLWIEVDNLKPSDSLEYWDTEINKRARYLRLSLPEVGILHLKEILLVRLSHVTAIPSFGLYKNDDVQVFYPTHDAGFFSICSTILQEVARNRTISTINAKYSFKSFKNDPNYNPWLDFFQINSKSGDSAYFSSSNSTNILSESFFGKHLRHHVDYKTLDFIESSYLLNRYFNPSLKVQSRMKDFVEKYSIDFDKTICICFRGTDKWKEIPPTAVNVFAEEADRLVERFLNAGCKVWIQTDQQQAQEFLFQHFQRKYGDGKLEVFSLHEIPTTTGTKVVHSIYSGDKLEFAINLLAVTLMMSKCHFLVTHTGNMAFWSVLFRGNMDRVVQL